jgi:Protein of unknown function (DUF998)
VGRRPESRLPEGSVFINTATTSPVLAKQPFLRAAGVCGLLVPVTVSIGWIGGALAQPCAYSSADDDLSDLGALTANKAWLYNQIGDNLTGILIILLGLGVWRALSPDVLGRIGAGAVMLIGLVFFVEGFFRLDCRGIDPGCTNESWHSSAHKMNNRFAVAATIAAPLILAFAFRRIPEWRGAWLPSLAAVPASLVCGVLFSVLGNGASVRAASLTLLAWLVFLAVRLMRTANARQVQTDVTEFVSIPAFSGRRRQAGIGGE